MTTKVAPWLQGLDEAWEPPQGRTEQITVSSASHDATAIQNSTSRIPRRSLNGPPSALRSHHASQKTTDSRERRPLTPVDGNNGSIVHRQTGTMKTVGARSLSAASNVPSFEGGTVQQRSKSSSPSKKQETMEWKKRLVQGQLGYGDQTDLFGPSGLENIFSNPRGVENQQPQARKGIACLQKTGKHMPSSPPPWPSFVRFPDQADDSQDRGVDSVVDDETACRRDSSLRSDPFDLHASEQAQPEWSYNETSALELQPNPDELPVEALPGGGNRTLSGQTELDQEDFSPVFISKHTTVTGQINYAALDSHTIKMLQKGDVDLTPSNDDEGLDSSPEPDERQDSIERDSMITDRQLYNQTTAPPDLSFSENLPTGSPFPNLGNHVELKRGGYSQYGSFKQRPLSPSQTPNELSLDHDTKPLLSDEKSSQLMPSSPAPPLSNDNTKERPRSSGSPLKLFGDHDTFTSNRLLRRISQLNPDETVAARSKSPAGEGSPLEFTKQDQTKYQDVSLTNSFGNGELDDHTFAAELTIARISDSANDDSDQSPGSEVPVPGSKIPQDFKFEVSPEIRGSFKVKRKNSKSTFFDTPSARKTSAFHRTSPGHPVEVQDGAEMASRHHSTQGKRPPTSPFKDPTPKRRRTLHASEVEVEIAEANAFYHSQLQEVVSNRKRKDARPGMEQNAADPEVLAQRRILRPRSSTPSRRDRQQVELEVREATEEFAALGREKLEAVIDQIESSVASDSPASLKQQAETLASEVAAFTLNVQKPSGEYVLRKKSVTTQDFLDEAMMVMKLIRAKARPQSNLGSVEESEAEPFDLSVRIDGSQHDASLKLSRPPSREGSGWRSRNEKPQTNSRVISHLRKFEEKEERDDTDFIAQSIASLQVNDDECPNENLVVVDEESNIRITGPMESLVDVQNESDSRPVSQRSQQSNLNTQSTQNSAGTSTGRTIGTSSTRKSDNVGTLAPDAVAHLIGEQVGGMTFDKIRKRWVRVSKNPGKEQGQFLEAPSNVTSDDDPFREISDLPVDEQTELRRISSPYKIVDAQKAVSHVEHDSNTSLHDASPEERSQQPSVETRQTSTETVVSRPLTRDGDPLAPHLISSSAPSRHTVLPSSQQEKVETRATSWSDYQLARLSATGKTRQQQVKRPGSHPAFSRDLGIGLGEMQEIAENSAMSHRSSKKQGQNDVDHTDEQPRAELTECTNDESALLDDAVLDGDDSVLEYVEQQKLNPTPSRISSAPKPAYRGAARQVSLRRQTLKNRFAAETHEQSELSFLAPLPGDRLMSLSLSVSRPLSARPHAQGIAEIQSSPSKGGSSLLFSDLPEFTVHEDDHERPSERALAVRLAQHAAAEVDDRYALAVKDLVKTLTDVHEDEPYWEDIKELDLRDRSLTSLYGLEDFCTRTKTLDVSGNALSHVQGAPTTIRRFIARSNQISSLTPWGHLSNLQYLDLSKNRLDNLDGLGCLIHLRELRADENEIKSIDGILELDGLQKLKLRRNRLKLLDFDRSQLLALTHLNLSENVISEVSHIEQLPALKDLRLDGNPLRDPFYVSDKMWSLKTLSMRRCGLHSLDAAHFPQLRQLDVDDNSLSTIDGLEAMAELELLSLRRQKLPDGLNVTVFDRGLEARVVRLSGCTIPSLTLSSNYFNLQQLELASVGLHELPDDFGLKMPNLRSLNVNFNNLKDVRPLLNIHKLESLSICGNRLNRLRRSVATLAKLRSLKTVDMRDNPLTQGFCTTLTATVAGQTNAIVNPRSQPTDDPDDDISRREQYMHILGPGDGSKDEQHQAHLDEDTKLRRRVFELLLGNSCPSLDHLNGVPFHRSVSLVKDQMWHRLLELGIVRKSIQ